MWLLRLRGAGLTFAAAALMIGAAGYALAGPPALGGSPRLAADRGPPVPLTRARKALLGQFDAADTWITISEGYAARGRTADAVGVMNSAIRARPTDFALWVGLGNALVRPRPHADARARGSLSCAPPSSPRATPRRLFFLGLAEARSGQPEQALARWRSILANAPADATWRPLVEDAVLALSAGVIRPVRRGRIPGRALRRPPGGGSCPPTR